jgi:hypothetical protein
MQNTKNYLLVRDDVGRSKPNTRNLPSSHFTYGIRISKDREDAGAVISSWAESSKRSDNIQDHNFRRLNILSVGEKKVTATQQREFRKTAQHRRMSSVEPKSAEIPGEMIYGMALRPSTPIKAVLGHFYGQVASDYNHLLYSNKSRAPSVRIRNSSPEKNCESVTKDLFKMKKFLKVAARTSTRRTKSEMGDRR